MDRLEEILQGCSERGVAHVPREQIVLWLIELKRYREKPLAQMQPCWKYVRENTIDMQLDHIISEINEVRKELNMGKKSLEGFDCHQATLTLMYIFAKFDIDLKDLVNEGIAKNTNRPGGSYYE